jgi:CheY-like chemotaxis protein
MQKIILVVEDERILRDIITKKLGSEGFEAHGAIDISEAERVLEHTQVDLILLDLLLPGAEGYELLARIKNDPKRKDIPVIVFSNLSSEEDKRRAFRAGAWDFLVKAEHTPDTIVHKVRKALQQAS